MKIQPLATHPIVKVKLVKRNIQQRKQEDHQQKQQQAEQEEQEDSPGKQYIDENI